MLLLSCLSRLSRPSPRLLLIEGLPVTVGAELRSWDTMNEPSYDYHWIRPMVGGYTEPDVALFPPTRWTPAGIRSSCTGNTPPRFAIFARLMPLLPGKGLCNLYLYEILYSVIPIICIIISYFLFGTSRSSIDAARRRILSLYAYKLSCYIHIQLPHFKKKYLDNLSLI